MTDVADVNPASRFRRFWVMVAVLLVAVIVYAAWARSGLYGLPSVPAGITVERAGLIGLDEARRLDAFVRGVDFPPPAPDGAFETLGDVATQARDGMKLAEVGEADQGLEKLQAAVMQKPDNLVLANAYRMEVFRLRRAHLQQRRVSGSLNAPFPDYLDHQPIRFFDELVRKHPSRATKLSLALSWVDEMLLFPALEIKAPSSVEAVDILTSVLDDPDGDSVYVPALYARGLNYLHRPARLVWPETIQTPRDAAVNDLGLCVAIGRELGIGSPVLQATLAVALGDAYVKAGRINVARSWWQVAQNLCHDREIQEAVRRRYAWRDEEILDRLETELDRGRAELDEPMTDLALMWN